MVKNLNALSFAPYGRILAERPAGTRLPQGEEWEEAALSLSGPAERLYRGDQPVYLDYESGMTILSVARDAGAFQHFYLDKPVCIRPGISFSVAPYQGTSQARMVAGRGAWPKSLPMREAPEDLTLSRRIQPVRVYTFFYHEKERGFFFRGEAHPMLELTYVDKGCIHSVAGGQDLLLEQGDMAIYGPEQWHMQYAEQDCAPSYITITFDLEGDSLRRLLDRKFRTPQRAVTILQQMLRERDREDPYAGDMILCLLGELLLTVLREADGGEPAPLRTANAIRSENDMVGRAQRFISEHVREKLNVPMVSREVGVSPSYLTALFHKNLQISPGEYIRRAKLQESKLMIREGRMNFTEIAQLLQYSTVHHFSRQFKDKFGITPTEYAKSIR